MSSYEVAIWVFMLAAFLGFELIRRVSPLLHTPLMSLTNAISAIAVVGDSPADLAMGRAAGAGLLVGVLSGVGTAADLEPLADLMLPSVAGLLVRQEVDTADLE